MAFHIGGVVAIAIFYLVIFLIGLWASWKRRKQDNNSEDKMLAGRSLGTFVGILTLTATWVGGGYINGSAEAMYGTGLVWCQAPFGYSLSLFIGGMFFARKMRAAGYVTILDPFQELYGKRWGSFMFFPALGGEMLWSAAILAALGSTLAVMVNLDSTLSIIVSAAIAVSYTISGGLAAVVYTDVVQLFCIFVGLWLSIPYAMNNEAVEPLSSENTDWIGYIEPGSYEWGEWVDYYLLIILGGVPWQAYFQRVLSTRTPRQAQIVTVIGSVGCIIMVIPACLIGVIAKNTDWELTSLNRTIRDDEQSLVLPLVIFHLTPTWVSYMGLGAVSAAVMSSADSSIFSSSSMFARNFYTNVFREKASDFEQTVVLRVAVIVIACLSCAIAIYVKSVYTLFYLCSDIVYVMLFPQFIMAIHAPKYVNIYGSIVAYFLGLILRLLGGESVLGIPAVIKFPWYDEKKGTQYFPFRTLSMFVTLVSLILVSWLAKRILGEEKRINISDAPKKDATKFGIDNPAVDKEVPATNRRSPYPALELSSYKRN